MIAHQRHVLFRGHLDFAPVLCVFFPLVFFAFFLNWMVMPQGTRLQLPSGTGVNHLDPGEPVFMVAVDSGERLFFENQFMSVADFQSRLQKRAAMPNAPQVLLVEADSQVRSVVISELSGIARQAGLRELFFETQATRR